MELWKEKALEVAQTLHRMDLFAMVVKVRGCANGSLEAAIRGNNGVGVMDHLAVIPTKQLLIFARKYAKEQINPLLVLQTQIEETKESINAALKELRSA